MTRWFAGLAIAVGSVATFYAVDFLLNALRLERLPKNFFAVKAGVLYRSGQLRPEHFAQVVRTHGIRTVVALNPGDDPTEAVRAAALGIRFIGFNMPGSGQGDPQLFHQWLEILADPANRPVLVHCAAGAYRTGAAVALYRMVFDGWSLADAVQEMRYCGFAGQQDLIDHVRQTYAALPAATIARLSLRPAATQLSWRDAAGPAPPPGDNSRQR